MGLPEDLANEVKEIFSSRWDLKAGQKIPETEDIGLGNKAVELDATVLYADLADSTNLVKNYKWHFAAEVYKTYLLSCCRAIQANGGKITAFDGDRVMAVFFEGSKNTNAARTALNINYCVNYIVNPALKAQYTTDYVVKQRVGIDTSKLYVARTGIRNNNDLVWVGTSANYAAKLCALDLDGITSWVTDSVFNSLLDESKYYNGDLMWKPYTWNAQANKNIHGSTWWLKPK